MGDTRALPALLNYLRAYAVQDEATWAYGSGHPDLVQAAVAWGKRTATRLHVRRDACPMG